MVLRLVLSGQSNVTRNKVTVSPKNFQRFFNNSLLSLMMSDDVMESESKQGSVSDVLTEVEHN